MLKVCWGTSIVRGLVVTLWVKENSSFSAPGKKLLIKLKSLVFSSYLHIVSLSVSKLICVVSGVSTIGSGVALRSINFVGAPSISMINLFPISSPLKLSLHFTYKLPFEVKIVNFPLWFFFPVDTNSSILV